MATIVGTGGEDRLNGGADADSIRGLGADDTLQGYQGNDSLYGGGGNDLLRDGQFGSSDTASDTDLLEGGDGNDVLVKYQGFHFQDHDTLNGGAGDDRLVFNGCQTNDMADGGDGVDAIEVSLYNQWQSITALFDPTGFVVQLGGINTVFAANCERMFISVGTGADNVLGGVLNDTITSQGGGDTLRGGQGDDVISVSPHVNGEAAVSLSGGSGFDRLDWYADDSVTDSYVFNLQTMSFTRNGQVFGVFEGFEDFSFTTGNGADTVIGAADDDFFQGQGGADQFIGNGGDDDGNGGAGADTLYGGRGNDRLLGLFDNDLLLGEEGDDDLTGYTGDDTLNGGSGNDSYHIWDGDGQDVFIDASGIDTVRTNSAVYSIEQWNDLENLVGFGFGQQLTGNNRDNRIEAGFGSGADTLDGGRGADTLLGKFGTDSLLGGVGSDALDGGGGADTLAGGADADVLTGATENDQLHGGAGDDRLHGDYAPVAAGIGFGGGSVVKGSNAGNGDFANAIDLTDRFSLAPDPEIVASTESPHVTVLATGGGTRDYYKLELDGAGVPITLDIDRIGSAGTLDTYVRVYDSSGVLLVSSDNSSPSDGAGGSSTSFDSYVTCATPSAGVYYIEVSAYRENPVPAGVEYRLHVTVGDVPSNDVLQGGEGIDTLVGGLGSDTASFAEARARVIANTTTVTDDGFGNAETMEGIENLEGGRAADRLSGDAGANRLSGLGGRDALEGGRGADTLMGGAGADKLKGAAGADVFAYAALGDSSGGALDRLLDFRQGDGDKVDLSALDAIASTIENDAFTFIGTNAFSGAGGEVRFVLEDGKTRLLADVDGGEADLEIVSRGEVTFAEADLIL